MRKVTVSRMRERYVQTVLTFRIIYVYKNVIFEKLGVGWWAVLVEGAR